MKIGFSTMGDDRWMAGEVIVRNLFLSIRELGLADVRLALVAPDGSDRGRIESRYAADEYLYYPSPRRFSTPWLANRLSTRVLKRDGVLAPFLRRTGTGVLFGACLGLRYPNVGTLSWVPDFQHVHLPQLFSPAERVERDRTFAETARISTRVVLLSEAVAADFRVRVPRDAHKARVLSPITRVPPGIYENDPRDVVRRYHLPEKFFYLPNQFWEHKNHERVFEAMRDLQEKGTAVNLVCTGFSGDYRNTGHFGALWQKIARWNLGARVTYLGLIPHDDVLGLIRQSICVVNPSRFEGWGIGVDEARSVGKRILASDLPSHREQDAPATTYFDPANSEDLAGKLLAVWNDTAPGPDAQLESAARASLPDRLRSYAQAFVAVAREAAREAT